MLHVYSELEVDLCASIKQCVYCHVVYVLSAEPQILEASTNVTVVKWIHKYIMTNLLLFY